MRGRSEMRQRLNDALVLDPSRTAVLAIDTHRGHLDPKVATMPVAADIAADIVAACERLLEATRLVEIPTFYIVMHNRILGGQSEYLRNPFWKAVEDAREQLTPELESTIRGHNLPGSPGVEVMPEIAPLESDYVITSKHRLSSFLDTDLESALRVLGVDTLILIGINTNTCVQCAAFEGFNRDYRVIVASDCVHSMYGEDLHDFGLENVARCFGWVMSVTEIAEKLDVPVAATADAV